MQKATGKIRRLKNSIKAKKDHINKINPNHSRVMITPYRFGLFLLGGDKGIRTPDLCVANASLYQLSHIPVE